jgi:predicted nucleic acid-binding protein
MPRQVVIDASVVVRLILDGSPASEAIVRRDELIAPALLVAETANALATQVRFAALKLEDAQQFLEECFGLPIEFVPDEALASDALALARELDLSAYDACYVALAERLGLPLATADAQLAKRYERSELIP